MGDGSTKIALETLDALESRLQRVVWYLSGENEVGDLLHKVKVEGRDQTVQARLARLENNLGKLSSRSHEVHQLLSLCKSASTTCRLLLTKEFKIRNTLIYSSLPRRTYQVRCLQLNYLQLSLHVLHPTRPQHLV